MPKELHDQDGNVIRTGMTVVHNGKIFTVSHVFSRRHRYAVALDRRFSKSTMLRVMLDHPRLRCVHII